MEQYSVNVYKILKDVPIGTKLYSSLCGEVELSRLLPENEEDGGQAIEVKVNNGFKESFYQSGKFYINGEVLLFPSNEMRDWRRFFKRGDIIEYDVDGKRMIGVFDGWQGNSPYTNFYARYIQTCEDEWREALSCSTRNWRKADKRTVKTFLESFEEEYGGKLNLDTLEIDEPEPKFNPLDYVLAKFNGSKEWTLCQYSHTDEDGLTVFVGGNCTDQDVIPYEGNEKLLGTKEPLYVIAQ